MSDAQIFQLMGLVYVSVGIGAITRPGYFRKLMKDFSKSAVNAYYGGLMALVVGFLLVTFHNVWVMNWPVIITVIGWIALVKGVCLIAVPKFMLITTNWFVNKKKLMFVWTLVALLFGVLLLLLGFGVICM